MSPVRDHPGTVIDKFGGLWDRGDTDSVPIDHFTECENIAFIPDEGFGTRPGIDISQDVAVPLSNVRRIYNYPTSSANTLIVLCYNAVTNVGTIYHVVSSTLTYGPLLTKTGMIDFAFVSYAGRGYISPFINYTNGALTFQKGMQSEFLYVYRGDGTAATKAAGAALTGTMTVANGAAGHTDPGVHLFGFVSETDTGYLSPPGLLTQFSTSALLSVSFSSVDVSTDAHVTKRHLVATTKIVGPFNGDFQGYTYYFVPNATINDNTTTVLANISFYDADLVEDASHLFDNYAEIPAGASLTIYRDRLCLACTYTDISLILVSQPGEPEAINQITGLIVVPLDGNPITNQQELRDVFYVFKRSRTVSYADNGDEPSTWALVVVDNGLGTCVHGVATVLDSGAASVDFLIICTYQGISIFNGRYMTPELSWKVENYWKQLERNEFGKIQIVNAPIQKEIYTVLPTRDLLVGNYAQGMDWKKIRWAPWSFDQGVNTVAIHNIDEIVLGADLPV